MPLKSTMAGIQPAPSFQKVSCVASCALLARLLYANAIVQNSRDSTAIRVSSAPNISACAFRSNNSVWIRFTPFLSIKTFHIIK